jgi:hypothetical protein
MPIGLYQLRLDRAEFVLKSGEGVGLVGALQHHALNPIPGHDINSVASTLSKGCQEQDGI